MKTSDDQNTRLVREIRLTNLLSFGPEPASLPLERLNVLIGPNGAGKSNLIEALALLRAAPVPAQAASAADIRGIVRRGGGAQEFIWKGAKNEAATIDVVIDNPKGRQPLRHVLSFRADAEGFRLDDERVENETPYADQDEPYFYYRLQSGNPVINTFGAENVHEDLILRETAKQPRTRRLARDTVSLDSSILSQRRDPELYPEITFLAATYEQWRVYREWTFGRNTVFREPQRADMRNDRLEEDFSNLGLFLSRLRKTPAAKAAIVRALADLYEGLTDFETIVEGGSVQVFFTEGAFSIPATRLSDGTLRYLCLLAILLDPSPPPLVCIEEPELGLHPDILPKLADLLVGAAQRTQLIVTTHSDILVDAMTERPEAVVVCEKHDGRTQMRRLRSDDLTSWLEKYRLGQLWSKGQIGGTRW